METAMCVLSLLLAVVVGVMTGYLVRVRESASDGFECARVCKDRRTPSDLIKLKLDAINKKAVKKANIEDADSVECDGDCGIVFGSKGAV